MNRAIQLSVIDGDASIRRSMRSCRPRTPGQLHGYVSTVLGFSMPRVPMVVGHDSPFDYLLHSFLDDDRPAGATPDCIVWANRGGGKTQLGAIATLLDMLFKPGIQIRILGGSFDQSSRMHRYLRQLLLNDVFIDLVRGKCTGRFVELTNGSRVEVLSQSERSIRGQRVHKLRCDEVELFEPAVWEASQLVTRSGWCGDTFVPGSIEALSTMHKPFGLMQRLVRDARNSGRRVFRWSMLDTLCRCPSWRSCGSCALWTDCQGRAKHPGAGARGFLRIDDAIRQRHRVGLHVWNAEMLCNQPDRTECVYPEFEVKTHVIHDESKPTDSPPWDQVDRSIAFIGGIDFGYRAPTVVLWAMHDLTNDVITVFDELVLREHTTEQVIVMAQTRTDPLATKHVITKTQYEPTSRSDGTGGCGRGASKGQVWRVSSPGVFIADAPSSPMWFGADPAGHSRNEQTGSSTIALWKRAGFTIRTRSMEVAAGIAAVRSRLRRADGSIGLRIHARCVHLIEAMLQYRYPTPKSGSSPDVGQNLRDDVSPLKDGPDHACDALRYMIINMHGDRSLAQGRSY